MIHYVVFRGYCQELITKKKKDRSFDLSFYYAAKSDSALNLVGAEAAGTSVHMARSAVDDSLNALDVGLPSTVGTSVGVGNLNTEGHALATKITLRHSLHLLSE